jgi:hypothetical protein
MSGKSMTRAEQARHGKDRKKQDEIRVFVLFNFRE